MPGLARRGLRPAGEPIAGLDWDAAPGAAGLGHERDVEVPGVATYRVSDGRRVRVSPVDGADPVEVQASLEGRATAALLQQRRVLPLHVAAVDIDGQAVAVAGPPGVGKSSVACALADRGHLLLADDLAAVGYDASGWPVLNPAPPVMRVWANSAHALGWPTEERDRIKQGFDKFRYEMPARFADEPRPFASLYVLREHRAREVLIRPVTGFEKFETFYAGATYSRELLDTPAARAWHFAEVCRIAERVASFTILRPAGALQLKELADELERHAVMHAGEC